MEPRKTGVIDLATLSPRLVKVDDPHRTDQLLLQSFPMVTRSPLLVTSLALFACTADVSEREGRSAVTGETPATGESTTGATVRPFADRSEAPILPTREDEGEPDPSGVRDPDPSPGEGEAPPGIPPVFAFGSSEASEAERDGFYADFERALGRHVDRFSEDPPFWSMHRFLEASWVYFQHSGDARFAALLYDTFDAVWRKRDRKVGRVDAIRSQSGNAWSTAGYSDDGETLHAFVVHAGALLSAVVELAVRCLEDEALRAAYEERALRTLERAHRVLRYFDEDLRREERRAFYTWPPGIGAVSADWRSWDREKLPYNMTSAMARVAVALGQAEGFGHQSVYRDLAKELLRDLKEALETTSENAYVWRYRADDDKVSDVAHAGVDLVLALRGHAAGWVFRDEHIERFWQSLRVFAFSPIAGERQRLLAHRVDGSGESETRWNRACERWLALGQVERGALRICEGVAEADPESVTALTESYFAAFR